MARFSSSIEHGPLHFQTLCLSVLLSYLALSAHGLSHRGGEGFGSVAAICLHRSTTLSLLSRSRLSFAVLASRRSDQSAHYTFKSGEHLPAHSIVASHMTPSFESRKLSNSHGSTASEGRPHIGHVVLANRLLIAVLHSPSGGVMRQCQQ